MVSYTKISYVIELSKTKAELDFKIAYFSLFSKITEKEAASGELESVNKKLEELNALFEKEKLSIILPNQKKIDELAKQIASYNFEQILDAMRKKQGEPYSFIFEKGRLTLNNYNERDTIAKLNILLSRLPKKDQELVSEIVQNGFVSKKVKLESDIDLVYRFLVRLGISVIIKEGSLVPGSGELNEIPVTFYSRRIWLPKKLAEKVVEVNNKLQELSAQLHVKSAINALDSEIQEKYLEALREQDSLLEYYKSEEKLFVE